ncbi:hypothetical protein BDV11DRAFT_192475 [Aspergillus similis]
MLPSFHLLCGNLSCRDIRVAVYNTTDKNRLFGSTLAQFTACFLHSLLVRVFETLQEYSRAGSHFSLLGSPTQTRRTGYLWRYTINRLDLQSDLQNSSIVLPSIFACPFDRCGVRGAYSGLETGPRSCNSGVDVFLHPGTGHSHKESLSPQCQLPNDSSLCEHRTSGVFTVLVTCDIRRPVSPVARVPLLTRPRSPAARYY